LPEVGKKGLKTGNIAKIGIMSAAKLQNIAKNPHISPGFGVILNLCL